MPFKYVTTSILTTYLFIRCTAKKDIALKHAKHVFISVITDILVFYWFNLDGVYVKKLEFYFLGVTIKKLEIFRWRFRKFSTLYLSTFFAFYFKSNVLETLEFLPFSHPDRLT